MHSQVITFCYYEQPCFTLHIVILNIFYTKWLIRAALKLQCVKCRVLYLQYTAEMKYNKDVSSMLIIVYDHLQKNVFCYP